MNEELARRAVACRHWRWLPGMRCLDGSRMLRAGRDLSGPWQAWSDEHYDACACKIRPEETRDDLPDLFDPATLGCLLVLVREAHGLPALVVRRAKLPGADWERWVAMSGRSRGEVFVLGADGESVQGATEAAALVAALEAAP